MLFLLDVIDIGMTIVFIGLIVTFIALLGFVFGSGYLIEGYYKKDKNKIKWGFLLFLPSFLAICLFIWLFFFPKR